MEVPQCNTVRLSCCIQKYGLSNHYDDKYILCVSDAIYAETDVLMEEYAEKIIKTKNTLGIDDLDAATMHLGLGSALMESTRATTDLDLRSFRQGAFENLLFISNLVFGEASSFLLPWPRVLKLTESEVKVAVRYKALIVYESSLTSVGRDIDEEKLITLREKQQKYKIPDEDAEERFRKHMQKLVEENISAALCTTELQRTQTIKELDKILDLNFRLITFGKHPNASRFARGLGAIYLPDGDRKNDHIRLLYRNYVWGSLLGGQIEEDKCAAMNQLGNIFGLSEKEAKAIIAESAYKLCCQSISDGHSNVAARLADFHYNLHGPKTVKNNEGDNENEKM